MLAKTKTLVKLGLAAAVLATSAASLPSISQAAEPSALPAGSYQVADNWNHGGGWNHGGDDWRRHRFNGWNHHRYGYGYGYGYGGYDNWGGVAAAGIIGLAAGAAIANAGDRDVGNRYYAGDDYDSYCSARFRSFNPRTGNYTGFDGLQHRCVMR